MRIAVDARRPTAGRGVARYTRAMSEALTRAFPDDEWLPFAPDSRAVHGAAALTGRPRLDRLVGGADVVWAPAPAPLAVSTGVPLVLTVHDLSWERRPTDFTPYERLWHRLARPRRLARRAARIAAVSAATRDAVVAEWGIDPQRVEVIPPGPGLAAGPNSPKASRARPYFLAVGALEPRKAPELLVCAFTRARAAGLEAELLFAGDGRLAGALEGEGVRVLGHVPDDELRGLYAGALALVQPAWLEGFGLPPVEALALGTPAIVADLPVYSETVGDGALRVAPGDESALADALLRVAADAPLRARLVAAGAPHVARFSWERSARALREVLERAAS